MLRKSGLCEYVLLTFCILLTVYYGPNANEKTKPRRRPNQADITSETYQGHPLFYWTLSIPQLSVLCFYRHYRWLFRRLQKPNNGDDSILNSTKYLFRNRIRLEEIQIGRYLYIVMLAVDI